MDGHRDRRGARERFGVPREGPHRHAFLFPNEVGCPPSVCVPVPSLLVARPMLSPQQVAMQMVNFRYQLSTSLAKKIAPKMPASRPTIARDTRALAYTLHTAHTCVANHRHARIVPHAVELASPDKLRPLTSCGVGGHRRRCQGKQCKDVSASRVSRACISRCCHCCCQSPAKGGRTKSARMLHDNITSGSHSWPTRWRVRRRAHCAA